jgi:hypothetical protein
MIRTAEVFSTGQPKIDYDRSGVTYGHTGFAVEVPVFSNNPIEAISQSENKMLNTAVYSIFSRTIPGGNKNSGDQRILVGQSTPEGVYQPAPADLRDMVSIVAARKVAEINGWENSGYRDDATKEGKAYFHSPEPELKSAGRFARGRAYPLTEVAKPEVDIPNLEKELQVKFVKKVDQKDKIVRYDWEKPEQQTINHGLVLLTPVARANNGYTLYRTTKAQETKDLAFYALAKNNPQADELMPGDKREQLLYMAAASLVPTNAKVTKVWPNEQTKKEYYAKSESGVLVPVGTGIARATIQFGPK